MILQIMKVISDCEQVQVVARYRISCSLFGAQIVCECVRWMSIVTLIEK